MHIHITKHFPLLLHVQEYAEKLHKPGNEVILLHCLEYPAQLALRESLTYPVIYNIY